MSDRTPINPQHCTLPLIPQTLSDIYIYLKHFLIYVYIYTHKNIVHSNSLRMVNFSDPLEQQLISSPRNTGILEEIQVTSDL